MPLFVINSASGDATNNDPVAKPILVQQTST